MGIAEFYVDKGPATTADPVLNNGYFSYTLNGIQRYDDLRSEALATHRLLVVLYLPTHHNDWLSVSEDELILKKCAYWASLRGAPTSQNDTSQTVYIPKAQVSDATNLKTIFAALSRNEVLIYQLP